jgi:hypothetical protein
VAQPAIKNTAILKPINNLILGSFLSYRLRR